MVTFSVCVFTSLEFFRFLKGIVKILVLLLSNVKLLIESITIDQPNDKLKLGSVVVICVSILA